MGNSSNISSGGSSCTSRSAKPLRTATQESPGFYFCISSEMLGRVKASSRPDNLNSVPSIHMMEEENLSLKVLTGFCIYTLLTIYKIKFDLFLKMKDMRKSLGLYGTQGPGFCPQSHIHKRMTYISILDIILICSDYRNKIH